MTAETLQVLRGFLVQAGVHPRAADTALRCAAGGAMVSTPEICFVCKASRWTIGEFVKRHNIPVEVRAGRGGNLIDAAAFFSAWDEVHGGECLARWRSSSRLRA